MCDEHGLSRELPAQFAGSEKSGRRHEANWRRTISRRRFEAMRRPIPGGQAAIGLVTGLLVGGAALGLVSQVSAASCDSPREVVLLRLDGLRASESTESAQTELERWPDAMRLFGEDLDRDAYIVLLDAEESERNVELVGFRTGAVP